MPSESMARRFFSGLFLAGLLFAGLLAPALFAAEEVDEKFAPLKRNLQAIEAALQLPQAKEDSAERESAKALRSKVEQALKKDNVYAMEELLEKSVFCVVTINPEGRVRVARGPAELLLVEGEPALALVQVFNQSGGQQTLKPDCNYFGAGKNPFEVALIESTKRPHPLSSALAGIEMEYRLLKIRCDKPGKREVNLNWSAGQGTQDIGFRGEVSFLLNVAPRSKK